MNTNRPLFKIISATVALIFFITQTGWSQDQQYIPFNENQDQSQYLSPDQLQRFSDIKTALVEQHNATSGTPLQTEEEIITYLYDLINPLDFTVLKQLENEYTASVAEKEAAWQDFIGQKALLEDYYNQLDYLTSSLSSINLQIESVEQNLNDVEQDQEETQASIQDLESRVASKSSSVQSKLLEASTLESNINDLKAALSQLNDEKVVRKSDLDSAEALLNEKTAQKETLEAELDVILIDLNAKWEEVEAATDPVEKAQKEAEYAALQILYDDKLAAYDSFMLEYTAAQTAYQIALSAYENKLSAIDAAEAEITQSETDLLSDYETIKLLELEIDTLDEEIAAAASHYDYLGSMKSSLNGSLDRLNSKKTELETLYGFALNNVEQALEESGTNDKLQDFKAAVESEKTAKSLYEEALEAISSLISSLKNQDKKLQSALLAIILESSVTIQGDQVEVFYETGGQTVVLTEDQINAILLAISEGIVLADGETVSDEINRTETVRRSLRENYSKVFGREPTEKMLNAFVDIVSRTKIPAIRLFEILKRINDKNLKATEDQKLDAEDSAIDPGDVDPDAQDNLLLRIAMRLQDNSVSSELIKGAISYLTTLPMPLVSCGIIALGGLFEQIGKSASESRLAEEAILSDIFSGAINKDTTGELKLSLFALKQAAEANGVTLYGRNISGGALENTSSPFIAHINGNHYVLVKKVENGQVTYFDPAPGSDQTTSTDDFCKAFTGNVLALNAVGGGTVLGDDEMKGIFGAGLFSRIKSAVSKAVSKVSSAAKSVASSVSKAVSTAAKTVSKAVSSAAKTVSKAVSTAVKTVSKAVSSAAKTVSKAVSKAVSSTKNAAAKVVNAVSEAASKAKDVVVSAAEKAKETAANVKDAVVNYVSEKVEQARTVVSEKVEEAKTYISNKIDQGRSSLSAAVDTGKRIGAKIIETGKETGAKIADAGKQIGADLADAGNQIITGLSDTAEEIAAGLADVGQQILSGLTDVGIQIASDLIGLGTDIGEEIGNAVKEVFSGPDLLPSVAAVPDTDVDPSVDYDADPVVPDDFSGYIYPENSQDGMCIAEDANGLRQPDQSSPFPLQSPGLALYWGINEYISLNYITEQMLREGLPGAVTDVYFPGGMIPKNGLVLDVHGGRISSHPNAINIGETAIAKNTELGIKGPIIQTKSYDDVSTVLNWLDEKGATTNKVYYENVPAPRSQIEIDAKAIGNMLEEGGTVEYIPRPGPNERLLARMEFQKNGGYIQENDLFLNKNVYKSADDNLAGLFQSKSHGVIVNTEFHEGFPRPPTQFVPQGETYGPGYKYTIKNEPLRSTVDDLYDDVIRSADNSMDDGVKATARSAAGNTAKGLSPSAIQAIKYGSIALIVVGIALDAYDIHNAYNQDKEQGGGCNFEAAIGRSAGGWVGGVISGAITGAVVGGSVGFIPGLLIGAAIGIGVGLVTSMIGESAGNAVCEIAGTGAQQNSLSQSNITPIPEEYIRPPEIIKTTPIHETISINTLEISFPENIEVSNANSEVSGG